MPFPGEENGTPFPYTAYRRFSLYLSILGGIYGISKWALRSYAYALREECKPMGIGVSLINPGGTFTETRKKSSEEDRSLLETSDLGKVITLTFRLSPQAVLEEVNIRPLQGDTY